MLLALCVTAFNLSVKSSLEQAVLYLNGRAALGEINADASGLPSRHEKDLQTRGWWLTFKTYGMTGALLLLVGSLQFMKLPMMRDAINSGQIRTVKALQAQGVPLPFASIADRSLWGIERFLRRSGISIRDYSFKPYGPWIVQYRGMTEFLLQKGVDVNAKIMMGGNWPPPGIRSVVMSPLHMALTDNSLPLAQTLIAHGADVHAEDSIGRTPLIVAMT
jgi:hypothetical protein